jgi:membrane protein implicated in regulation of membrane protease activity
MSVLNGWLWLIAAFGLAALELLAPGWVFMGLAGAVGVMAVLLLSGAWSGGLPLALVATALLSAVIWFALRRLAGRRKGAASTSDSDAVD